MHYIVCAETNHRVLSIVCIGHKAFLDRNAIYTARLFSLLFVLLFSPVRVSSRPDLNSSRDNGLPLNDCLPSFGGFYFKIWKRKWVHILKFSVIAWQQLGHAGAIAKSYMGDFFHLFMLFLLDYLVRTIPSPPKRLTTRLKWSIDKLFGYVNRKKYL